MISPKSSEELKEKKSSIGRTSRKRVRSCIRPILASRGRGGRNNNSLYSDIEKCNIEVIPNNEEVEERIIVIKKEADDNYNEETLPDKRREFHTTYKQNTREKIPLTKTLSISEFDCNDAFKAATVIPKLESEDDCFSGHQRTVKDYSGHENEKLLVPKEIIGDRATVKKDSKYELKLNYGTHSDIDRKLLEREVDPEHMQWVAKLKIPERCQFPQHFMVDDFEEVKEILANFEHETFTRLLVSDVNGGFRLKRTEYSGETVHFREKGKQDLLFHGTPFAICGRLTFRCHQGVVTKRIDKERKRDQKYGPDRRRYRKFTSSKKKNCPFKITVVKVLVFPDYNVDLSKDSPSKLYKISSFIKKNKDKIKCVVKYIFTLPSVFDHRNHQLGDESVSREAVDKRVFDKVEEYVRAGITKAPVVKELLRTFIQYDLEVDPSQWERRKYNPSLKDIRAKIYRTLCDMKAKLEPGNPNGRANVSLKRKRAETSSVKKKKNYETINETFSSEVKENDKKELILYEPNLQQNVSVDLSEGNVHREEMIAIASIIDVHNDENDDDVNDNKRKKLISDDLSKLNLLSMILRRQNLVELGNDVSNVINKWRTVLNDVCETKNNAPKEKTKNVKKQKKQKVNSIV